MLLRIDDTDPARNVPGGEEEILRDLEWLGIEWNEGPVRQSERQARYREAAAPLGDRFQGTTLLREDGKKLSKRAPGATVGSLREAGIPAEAVRAYLEELGLPAHDVHYDLARIRRLSTEVIGAMADEDLAARVGAPVGLAPVLRGARDFAEAREYAESVTAAPDSVSVWSPETLVRFRELRERANGGLTPDEARSIVRELKAVGGHLKQLRTALTGRERGPELWTVLAALPRDETLRRIDAAL
jgi:glutamyl/glutaminyl-tRNA synthetase